MILDVPGNMELLKTTSVESTALKDCCVKHRVLVVDDDPAILFAYCRLLEREEIGVDACDCFSDALKNIQSTPYLAVVSDLRLAGSGNTDGLDVMRALRVNCPDTAFILVTGHGSREIEQEVCSLGAAHYFEKPVHPSIILEKLKSIALSFVGPVGIQPA